MNDLKKRLTDLASEFSKKNISDFNKLYENPTTKELEDLIRSELSFEQDEFPWNDFKNSELKQAASMLKEFYFCQERTLERILSNVNYKRKNENLIKVLVWKKKIAAIRFYITNNIFSEFNQMNWDLTPYMINLLFEEQCDSDFKKK